MKYFKIEPEVAGGFGENTIIDNTKHPPIISRLNYQFDGWSGDDILETFPCYIVTERLKNEIEKNKYSGCIFDDVEITKSQQFLDLFPYKKLPIFYWLKINGKPNYDDFWISEIDFFLIVSEKVVDILNKFSIENCDIEELGKN
jgi:hypothetical protein